MVSKRCPNGRPTYKRTSNFQGCWHMAIDTQKTLCEPVGWISTTLGSLLAASCPTRLGLNVSALPALSVTRSLAPLTYESIAFRGLTVMWIIGINQSSALLLSSPRELGGYGFSKDVLSYMYFAPIIGILIGGAVGRIVIDFASSRYVRLHNGIYAPEARIPPIYFATLFMVPGLVLLGQALASRLSWVAIAAGWILYVVGGIISTVATTTYLVDSYAIASAEISTILNFARLITGFAISYFQVVSLFLLPRGVKPTGASPRSA